MKEQIETVRAQGSQGITVGSGFFLPDIQTLFLVGGLGSNNYLGQYLERKFRCSISVKQPAFG